MKYICINNGVSLGDIKYYKGEIYNSCINRRQDNLEVYTIIFIKNDFEIVQIKDFIELKKYRENIIKEILEL